ncbi:hypothetical protein AB7W33_13550 [Providencia rettgeri]
MKWMVVGVAALLLVGCDTTSTAPFGLNWGQSTDESPNDFGKNH